MESVRPSSLRSPLIEIREAVQPVAQVAITNGCSDQALVEIEHYDWDFAVGLFQVRCEAGVVVDE